MASGEPAFVDSLYPIAVLIDELKNEDVQVRLKFCYIIRINNSLKCVSCVFVPGNGIAQSVRNIVISVTFDL